MAGLQRSTISFRRQGSSGIVWDDRLVAELNKQANEQKGETQQQGQLITPEGQDQTARPIAGDGIKPIKTEGGMERSRSNGGGANRHHRNTGRVSPAVDPPSPRLSAFGCCSAFGKKPVSQRKRPPKRRSRMVRKQKRKSGRKKKTSNRREEVEHEMAAEPVVSLSAGSEGNSEAGSESANLAATSKASIPQPLEFFFDSTDYTTDCKIQTRCYVKKTVSLFRKKEFKSELEWFLSHPTFHHFFHMAKEPNRKVKGMWMLLLRTVTTEGRHAAWFVVNGVPIRYSLREHAVLCGLDCADYPHNYKRLGHKRFQAKHFKGVKTITMKHVKERLLKMHEGEERLKMGVLYFLCTVIRGPSKSTGPIDPFILRIVDDLEACKTFPWGRLTFDANIKEIHHLNRLMQGRARKTHNFPGFIIPLEILAFECIAVLKESFRMDVPRCNLECPRMCKQRFKRTGMKGYPLEEIYDALGKSTDIKSILLPTLEEELMMAGIIRYDSDDEADDGVCGTWVEHLTVKQQTILWDELYERDLANREFPKKKKKKVQNEADEEEEGEPDDSFESALKGLEDRMIQAIEEKFGIIDAKVDGMALKLESLGKRHRLLKKKWKKVDERITAVEASVNYGGNVGDEWGTPVHYEYNDNGGARSQDNAGEEQNGNEKEARDKENEEASQMEKQAVEVEEGSRKENEEEGRDEEKEESVNMENEEDNEMEKEAVEVEEGSRKENEEEGRDEEKEEAGEEEKEKAKEESEEAAQDEKEEAKEADGEKEEVVEEAVGEKAKEVVEEFKEGEVEEVDEEEESEEEAAQDEKEEEANVLLPLKPAPDDDVALEAWFRIQEAEEEEAERLALVVYKEPINFGSLLCPEEVVVSPTKKRGRPKKTNDASPPKRRGRPKKNPPSPKQETPKRKRKGQPSRWVSSPFTEGKTDDKVEDKGNARKKAKTKQ